MVPFSPVPGELALEQACGHGHRAQVNLDVVPGHAVLLDDAAQIVACNAAWRRFADANGYEGNSYGVGSCYLAACGGGRAARDRFAGDAVDSIRAVLSGTSSSGTFVYPCHAPNRKRWFRMLVTPIVAGDRRFAVVTHLDVTPECERSASLARELCELRSDGAARERMAGIVHDLKSPLNAMGGMCEYLLRELGGPVSAKQKEYLGDMLDACSTMHGRIERAVDDLIEVPQHVPADAIDLARLLAEIGQRHAAEAARAGMRVRCEPASGLPPLHVPREAVERMIGNLIGNAIRYAGSGATIRLSARHRPSRVEIVVADDGVGAAIGTVRRARKRPAVRRGEIRGGNGVGLVVVRRLAAIHGGALSLRSAPGRGFVATLTFAF